MATKTEAIKIFLEKFGIPDLAALYTPNMEVQVNVAQDHGERIQVPGSRSISYTDNLTTWSSFRIPHKAATEPEYEDKEIRFDLSKHADSIGMTGWDFKDRVSKWVAFDFDAITGHSEKHAAKNTQEELDRIKQEAMNIEWVTIRKSTSGKGLHLYVFLPDVPTANHTEHAALGRSILGMLSALTGYDFNARVDACGGNMWIWSRRSRGTDGLSLIKQGDILYDYPQNWRDHLVVVNGSRRKNLPQDINDLDIFEEICGQRHKVPLDDEHRRLINYLKDSNALWWWDQDHHMLVTHTSYLEEAHRALGMKGMFKTNSEGTDKNTQNCFLFPLRRGSWSVRRYTPGVQEDPSWQQDGQGYTRTFLNREPDFVSACRAHGGLEDTKGAFFFRTAEMAMSAASELKAGFSLKQPYASRPCTLRKHKDGRLIVEFKHDLHDKGDELVGWNFDKKQWIRIFDIQEPKSSDIDTANFDDVIRHVVTEQNEDYGWAVRRDHTWGIEPLSHVKPVLMALGTNSKELQHVLGASILKPWRLVNKPFQPEYPGDREWNRNAAQLCFKPNIEKGEYDYPTWYKILEHCGKDLNESVQRDAWCKANGITRGAEYLKLWIASLFQEPEQPLPYLFFFGPENSGKSIFHEALSLLFTRGYKRADNAVLSPSGFNAELEGALLCVVEEVNLGRNQSALNRIKDWVTSPNISIHRKGETPYHTKNLTHWVQTANSIDFCPVFPGDSRITMVYVDALEITEMIPKKRLLPLLEQEAADFLGDILTIQLPESNDRLNIPILTTMHKQNIQYINASYVDIFLNQHVVEAPGCAMSYRDFYDFFITTLPENERHQFTIRKFGAQLPAKMLKGRSSKNGEWQIANVRLKHDTNAIPVCEEFVLKGDTLVPKGQEIVIDHRYAHLRGLANG
jgi:hypothetical protein